jgi:hypothetical protein
MRFFITKDNREHIKAEICKHIDRLDDKRYQCDIEEYEPKRTNAQNRLQRDWMNQLAAQGDRTAEEYRAETKLCVGVPILRAEDETFKAGYDEVIRPMDYETKLKLMAIPLDFPVTRLMTKDQKKRYLDAMYNYWVSKGYQLTVKE